MIIPKKGDPRRPVYAAAFSLITLGMIQLAVAGFSIWALMPSPKYFRRSMLWDLVSLIYPYAGPGVVYIVLAIFLARAQRWAAIVSLALVLIQLVYQVRNTIVFIGFRWMPMLMSPSRDPALSRFEIISAVNLLFVILFSAVAWRIRRSFEAMRRMRQLAVSTNLGHGFEPIMNSAANIDAPTPGAER